MPVSWIDALKKWNEGREKWSIPRKGTPEYDEVMKMMGKPKKGK